MSKVRPKPGYLVCKLYEAQAKTASGFLLEKNDDTDTLVVQSCGKGVDIVDPGMRIVIQNGTATTVAVDGTDYYVVHERNVIGVVTDGSQEA